jgi:hypothetical protein
MGRAKSFSYWLQGLWLRLIRAPRYSVDIPFYIQVQRAFPKLRASLLENMERSNPLFDRLVLRANEKPNA